MKKYFEYKNEIQGLEDVLKTVKTTEKVSASQIHFFKKEVKNLDLYIKSLKQVIGRLLLFYSAKNHPLLSQKKQGKEMLAVMTGSKGLVGDLYHNVVNLLLEEVKNYHVFLSIGDKGEQYLNEEGIKIEQSFPSISEELQPQKISIITDYIFTAFQTEGIKSIDVIYPQFISLSQQRPSIVQMLPFEFSFGELSAKKQLSANKDLGFPVFEPSIKKNFDKLLKKYIKIFFYKIMTEARLSEISARTVAMEHASIKTKESIQDLLMNYLKQRRKFTTQKQIESFIIHQTL